MTIKEVAQKTGVTEQTVRRWIKAGKLKAKKVRVGLAQRLKVEEKDLKKFLQE